MEEVTAMDEHLPNGPPNSQLKDVEVAMATPTEGMEVSIQRDTMISRARRWCAGTHL